MAIRKKGLGYFVETQAHGIKMPSMHHHDQYELYYLHSGTRDYFVEDSFFSVVAGDFVLIAPGKLHRTGGTYSLRTLIMFSTDCLHRVYTPSTAAALLECFQNVHIVPQAGQRESLQALLQQMEDCENEIEFGIHLGNLLCVLSKCQEKTDCNPGISRIIQFINQNYATIHSIDDIAGACFLSKYHLCRMFRAAMGMTVVDYLNQIRVKAACAHLIADNLDIKDIATACGFHSVAYFSTVFKKYIGISPSAYRIQKGSPN